MRLAGTSGELRALTGARGIAAWLVVLYHIRLTIAGLPAPAVEVFAKGYLAVDFFFLLSGFVIALAWGPRLHAGGWRAVPAFWLKRVARVWPLHACMLAVALALALVLAASGRHDTARFPFDQLPLHLLLLQNWGLTDHLAWNDPAWSISTECAAYLLFPVLACATDARRWPTSALLAGIAALLAALHLLYAVQGSATLGTDIAHLGLWRCLAEFAVGTMLYALWQRWRRVSSGTASAGLFTALTLGMTAAGLVPETIGVPAGFAALLLALALGAGTPHHPLEGRFVHYLGEISYATYLSHFVLFIVFKLAFVRDAHAVPPALIALYLVAVLAASVLLYHGVERPAQRRLLRLRVPRAERSASLRHS